jgi:hypothetical protein
MQTFGWQDNGEYNCPCGTMLGKNLLGERPFSLVREHVSTCLASAYRTLENGHPSTQRPERYNELTWDRAIMEYMQGKRYRQATQLEQRS